MYEKWKNELMYVVERLGKAVESIPTVEEPGEMDIGEIFKKSYEGKQLARCGPYWIVYSDGISLKHLVRGLKALGVPIRSEG